MSIVTCDNDCQNRITLYLNRKNLYLGGSTTIAERYLNGYIPNVFRKCWQLDKLNYPCGCPFRILSLQNKYIDPQYYYDPNIIIDINIKSMFYFGVKTTDNKLLKPFFNIKYTYIKNYIKGINFQNESNYTNFLTYFRKRYSTNTLIFQYFYLYLNMIYIAYTPNIDACNFIIPWNYTMVCPVGEIKNTNFFPDYFTPSQIQLIYKVYLTYFINNPNGNVNINTSAYKNLNVYFRYSFKFLRIITIFLSVLQDIYTQYNYRITCNKFCIKPYMSKKQFIRVNNMYKKYLHNV